MKTKLLNAVVAGVFAALAFVLVTGCATADPDNRSERPWTQRQGWEGGLPMGINEGR